MNGCTERKAVEIVLVFRVHKKHLFVPQSIVNKVVKRTTVMVVKRTTVICLGWDRFSSCVDCANSDNVFDTRMNTCINLLDTAFIKGEI